MNNSIRQICTSFPSRNHIHIDYVIKYEKQLDEDQEVQIEKKSYRRLFFNLVEKERIEVHKIRIQIKQEEHVFALLHCPLKRLLKEAESIKLEMKLKSVSNIAV